MTRGATTRTAAHERRMRALLAEALPIVKEARCQWCDGLGYDPSCFHSKRSCCPCDECGTTGRAHRSLSRRIARALAKPVRR